MIDRILVPLDGSSLAECVLPHTVAVSQALDAEVTLLRAVVREAGPVSRGVDPLEWQMRKSEADSYLDEIGGRLEDAGLEVRAVLEEGQAAERIINYARNNDVGLIIISSHGSSGLSRWNISSVVQKVILKAYAPVMIVRAYREKTEEVAELHYRKLMVPLDGSIRAECTLPWAQRLAHHHHCKLFLAHVVDRAEVPRNNPLTEEERELVERLTELNRRNGEEYLEDLMSRVGSDAEARLVVSDDRATALHDLVKEEEVDVVVMAAHGYSGRATWPYGSMALNFIAYGSTPLLMVQDLTPEEVAVSAAERAARERAGH